MPIPIIAPMLVESISQMLWDFGFRHHPTKQKKWIDGVAGIGTLAQMVDKPPKKDAFEAITEEFLAEENPKLLEAIRKAPPEERDKLLKDLEKNFGILAGLIEELKKVTPEQAE